MCIGGSKERSRSHGWAMPIELRQHVLNLLLQSLQWFLADNVDLLHAQNQSMLKGQYFSKKIQTLYRAGDLATLLEHYDDEQRWNAWSKIRLSMILTIHVIIILAFNPRHNHTKTGIWYDSFLWLHLTPFSRTITQSRHLGQKPICPWPTSVQLCLNFILCWLDFHLKEYSGSFSIFPQYGCQ